MSSFLQTLAERLGREQEEVNMAGEITEVIFPIIGTLERKDVVNPVILKIKLNKLSEEYNDITYGLFRIATDAGPEGSIIILDEKKVASIVADAEGDVIIIIGLSKKIIDKIKYALSHKKPVLYILMQLVNDVVNKALIESPTRIAAGVKISTPFHNTHNHQK